MRSPKILRRPLALESPRREHPAEAEQCAYDDMTKDLGLVVFLLMAIPAGVRLYKQAGKEKELTASFDHMKKSVNWGLITPDELFAWVEREIDWEKHREAEKQPKVPIALQNVFAVILYAASLALVMADYEGTSGVWLKHVPEDLRALASLVILAAWGFVFLTAIVVAVHIPGFLLRGLRKNQPGDGSGRVFHYTDSRARVTDKLKLASVWLTVSQVALTALITPLKDLSRRLNPLTIP
jgi:hypothetical protein